MIGLKSIFEYLFQPITADGKEVVVDHEFESHSGNALCGCVIGNFKGWLCQRRGIFKNKLAYIFEVSRDCNRFLLDLPQYLPSLVYFCFIIILLLFLVIVCSFQRVGNKAENESTLEERRKPEKTFYSFLGLVPKLIPFKSHTL